MLCALGCGQRPQTRVWLDTRVMQGLWLPLATMTNAAQGRGRVALALGLGLVLAAPVCGLLPCGPGHAVAGARGASAAVRLAASQSLPPPPPPPPGQGALSRRDLLADRPRALCTAAAAGLAVGGAAVSCPETAFAAPAVGEGGLPDGTRQFDSVLRMRVEWDVMGRTVEQSDVPSPAEWRSVQAFLRRAYQVGYDMRFIAKRLDKAKQVAALEVVDGIQRDIEAADGPAQRNDKPAFLEAQKKVALEIQEFLDYLTDVPAEL